MSVLFGAFAHLPEPAEDCTGRTVIVTGANVGLGLEAARHFARLGAARVVVACRSADKAARAVADIEASTPGRKGVVEHWALDLESHDSVREFARRAAALDRLDALVNNASVMVTSAKFLDGQELTVAVNDVSTFLLCLLVLPTLRRTSAKFNVETHLCVVASDAAKSAFFSERNAPDVFAELAKGTRMWDRYSVSKLIQIIAVRELAAATGSSRGGVVINSVHPGLCRTQLFRHVPWPASWVLALVLRLIGRTSEQGSRTLMAGAFAGAEARGRYMADCVVAEFPKIMQGEAGRLMGEKVWAQLLAELEKIEPGVSKNI